MATTRRTFIRHVAALGPVAMTFWIEPHSLWAVECNKPNENKDCTLPDPPRATRFIPNEPRVGIRYSAAEMAQSSRARQLQTFRDAICMVRNLDPDDVISWTKYVAQHCTLCARSNTNNVHYNWQFPTWHRGFLYFLERQMRIMSKNDDLRLIYWDWENRNSRVLPDIYAPKDQPLYWENRYLGSKTFPLKDDEVNVQPLLSLQSFEAFGGTLLQKKPTPALYSGPHANVHNAFADPDERGVQGDMANLQYSPRDPVFYAHHGNIDRVWASWNAAGRQNPDFGDAKVYFYDEKKDLRFVLLNDLRDTRTLGYQYSSLIKPAVTPSKQKRFTAAMKANRVTLSAAALERVSAPTPDFLHVRDIQNLDQFPMDARRFGIFKTKPPIGTDATTSHDFLGMVSRVLSGGHAHAEVLSAAIEVTGRLTAEVTKGIDLFIAPLDAERRTTAEAIPLVAEAITVIS
jgi:Common central domain of tyrosinase/Polyphenol oxidase middle domain